MNLIKTKKSKKGKIQKKAEATGDLTGNKIADKVTKVSRSLPPNTTTTVKQKMWDLIDKYQKKDIYLQKEDSKLLIS